MKLYNHYKNKPYKFVDIARHSETSEELVVYETLYESSGGKLWVRPKNMFFEDVILDGKSMPRFKKVELSIQQFSQLNCKEIEIISSLSKSIFGGWDQNKFDAKFEKHKSFSLHVAYIENQPVGFKLGYVLNSQMFYSWLGGVLPSHRGIGIASDLQKAQIQWCKEQGYLQIRTKTKNSFKEMLLLNIKTGFEIVATEQTAGKDLKIVLDLNLK